MLSPSTWHPPGYLCPVPRPPHGPHDLPPFLRAPIALDVPITPQVPVVPGVPISPSPTAPCPRAPTGHCAAPRGCVVPLAKAKGQRGTLGPSLAPGPPRAGDTGDAARALLLTPIRGTAEGSVGLVVPPQLSPMGTEWRGAREGGGVWMLSRWLWTARSPQGWHRDSQTLAPGTRLGVAQPRRRGAPDPPVPSVPAVPPVPPS